MPRDLLSTKIGGTLSDRLENIQDLTPLERVSLTSAGNLQELVSAYYDKPVGKCICSLLRKDYRKRRERGCRNSGHLRKRSAARCRP